MPRGVHFSNNWYIAKRYLRGGRRHRFGRVVGLFSFLSLLIGVASLVLVMSVMNGFHAELSGRFLQVLPHATWFDGQLDRLEPEQRQQVVASSPMMEAFVLLTAGGNQAPATLTAVNPDTDPSVVDMAPLVRYGSWQDFSGQPFGMLVGMQLANRLGLDVGDEVRVNFAHVRVLPTGLYPLTRGFVVSGIFDSQSQVDNEQVLVRLADAGRFLQMAGAETGLRLRLDSPDRPMSTGFDDREGWIPWQDRLGGLYQAMQMEKVVVGTMLCMVILIASFSLVASQLMNVAEKRSDIAILRTMGASEQSIRNIFVLQAMMFGLLGVVPGLIAGSLLSHGFSDLVVLFERISGSTLFNPNVYYVSYLPTRLQAGDLLVISVVSLLICLFSAWLPASRAARISPAEAIHAQH